MKWGHLMLPVIQVTASGLIAIRRLDVDSQPEIDGCQNCHPQPFLQSIKLGISLRVRA